MNGGQQYTTDGLTIVIRGPDLLDLPVAPEDAPALNPTFGYASGGALVAVRWATAYLNLTSPRARCVFAYTLQPSGEMRKVYVPIFSLLPDERIAKCYAPPAAALDATLAQIGGVADVYLSSNYRDLSGNSAPFRYRPDPTIDSVAPVWLCRLCPRLGSLSVSRTIVLRGSGYFEPSSAGLARLTSNSDPT